MRFEDAIICGKRDQELSRGREHTDDTGMAKLSSCVCFKFAVSVRSCLYQRSRTRVLHHDERKRSAREANDSEWIIDTLGARGVFVPVVKYIIENGLFRAVSGQRSHAHESACGDYQWTYIDRKNNLAVKKCEMRNGDTKTLTTTVIRAKNSINPLVIKTNDLFRLWVFFQSFRASNLSRRK